MSNKIKPYLQPSFLLCVAVLGISALGMSIGLKALGVYTEKEPLLLRKSLDLLDENGLGSYKVITKRKIENPEIVESLGTEDYIEWVIEDTNEPSNSSKRIFSLFITYYELPDRVPHSPEECYVAGGNQLLSGRNVAFKLQRDDGVEDIPGKCLLFSRQRSGGLGGSSEFPVLYFFRVNGIYAGNRTDARGALYRNIFSRYAYFTKVELKFFNSNEEDAVAASVKLLNIILPILERDHWPD